jgi:undecaprenyl-diphosphatase
MHIGSTAFDRSIYRAARRHPASKASRLAARACSPGIAIAEGIAAAVMLDRGRLRIAAAAPAAILAAKALKQVTHRPRPLRDRFKRNGRKSFPSTHVAGPAALLTILWRVAPPTGIWRAALLTGTMLVGTVALERLRAGAHWPTDVAAGAALGVAVGAMLGRNRSDAGSQTCAST